MDRRCNWFSVFGTGCFRWPGPMDTDGEVHSRPLRGRFCDSVPSPGTSRGRAGRGASLGGVTWTSAASGQDARG